jgi:hypothetical protein
VLGHVAAYNAREILLKHIREGKEIRQRNATEVAMPLHRSMVLSGVASANTMVGVVLKLSLFYTERNEKLEP